LKEEKDELVGCEIRIRMFCLEESRPRTSPGSFPFLSCREDFRNTAAFTVLELSEVDAGGHGVLIQ